LNFVQSMLFKYMKNCLKPNPTLKFAPSGRWDAPSARPLAIR
jgi:hypothetical protein